MSNYRIVYQNELNHYGVRGMKWGVRKQVPLSSGNRTRQPLSNQDIYQRKMQRRARAKKIAIVGGAIAATALAGYGAYKLNKLRGSAHVSLGKKYSALAQQKWNLREMAYEQSSRSGQLADQYRKGAYKLPKGSLDRGAYHRIANNNARSSIESWQQGQKYTEEWLDYAKKAKDKSYSKKELVKEMYNLARKRG